MEGQADRAQNLSHEASAAHTSGYAMRLEIVRRPSATAAAPDPKPGDGPPTADAPAGDVFSWAGSQDAGRTLNVRLAVQSR